MSTHAFEGTLRHPNTCRIRYCHLYPSHPVHKTEEPDVSRYGAADANPGQSEDQAARFNTHPRMPDGPPLEGWRRVTAESILDADFTYRGLPWWGGYDETEVDDELDQVWHTLKRYEANDELLGGLANQLERRGDVTSRDFAARIREVLVWPKDQ